MLKKLPNLLVVLWTLLVLASFYLGVGKQGADHSSGAALTRLQIFLIFQGTALAIAAIAAWSSHRRRDPRGTMTWWMGWGPLVGSGVIASIVLLAVLTFQVL